MAWHLVIYLLIAVVVIGAVWFNYQRAKKRRELMASWARTHGWTWQAEDDSFTGRFEGTPFGLGHNQRARNVVQGSTEGRVMVAFDYTYQTTSGSGQNRHTTTHHYGIVAMSMPAAVPTLDVGYEGAFSSMARGLGFHDIEFENGRFNQDFKVTSADRKFAYDVINPRMMEWLSATHGPEWRMDRADILCWQSGSLEPAAIEQRLAFLDAVLDRVPAFVWSNARGSTA